MKYGNCILVHFCVQWRWLYNKDAKWCPTKRIGVWVDRQTCRLVGSTCCWSWLLLYSWSEVWGQSSFKPCATVSTNTSCYSKTVKQPCSSQQPMYVTCLICVCLSRSLSRCVVSYQSLFVSQSLSMSQCVVSVSGLVSVSVSSYFIMLTMATAEVPMVFLWNLWGC